MVWGESAPQVSDTLHGCICREVETVFHEFGHALQHMMTKQAEGLVAGIRGVEWDAVELPSQFMENWCYNRATLNTFARHYETNEPLPEELYKKLVAARTFRSAHFAIVQHLPVALCCAVSEQIASAAKGFLQRLCQEKGCKKGSKGKLARQTC